MNKIIYITLIINLFNIHANCVEEEVKSAKTEGQIINIYYSPDIQKIVDEWSAGYSSINPELKINIIKVSPNELAKASFSKGALYILSDDYFSQVQNKSLLTITLGRDIIVPVINKDNPLINKIKNQGLSHEALLNILQNKQSEKGMPAFNISENISFNYYFLKSESIKLKVRDFLNLNKENISGIEIENSEELIRVIQNDPNGICFCHLTDIINTENQELKNSILILPIDKNGNGNLDYSERIYSDLNDFTRGVWIGKYPKSLINNIYSVSLSLPHNTQETAFLKWILTMGQKVMNQNGFSELVYAEKQSKLEKLTIQKYYSEEIRDQHTNFRPLVITGLLISLFVILGFVIKLALRKQRNRIKDSKEVAPAHPKLISESSLMIPNGLYYDKTHTWAFMEKDGIVRIGIDDFIQHLTGKITRIEMKNPGDHIKKNDLLFSLIQDGKHLNIHAPFTGKIIDINESLVTHPSKINFSPYAEGWVYMIEPSNWSREIQFLRMAEKYKKWLKDEFLRLKDFLSTTINSKTADFNFVIYQEGGEIKDNLLKDFGPELWEDFQKQFIDTSEFS